VASALADGGLLAGTAAARRVGGLLAGTAATSALADGGLLGGTAATSAFADGGRSHFSFACNERSAATRTPACATSGGAVGWSAFGQVTGATWALRRWCDVLASQPAVPEGFDR
jgi:hypothetical protein